MKSFFRRLYYKFVQKKADVVVAKVDSKPVSTDDLKWGFVVPHTKKAAGAVLKITIKGKSKVQDQEYFYAMDVIDELASKLGVTKATRDEGGLKGAFSWLNIEGCNASIEPHLNAFNTKAEGYEVLILDGDSTSEVYAKELLALFGEMFPKRVNRGIKRIKAGGRGFSNLMAAKEKGMKVALLTELFFIDNPKEFISRGDMVEFFNRFLIGKDV